MRIVSHACIVLACIAAGLVANRPAAAHGCPEAVTAAALAAVPGARIGGCETETEGGVTCFEVEAIRPDGREVEVEVSADGKLIHLAETIAESDLPPAVAAAFRAKFPKARMRTVEKVTLADGAVRYEVTYRSGLRTREAAFGTDGTPVTAD